MSKYELDLIETSIETYPKVSPWIIDNIEVCRELCNIKKHTIDSAIVKRVCIRHSETHQRIAAYYTDRSKTNKRVGHAYATMYIKCTSLHKNIVISN